jgi:hypothetical protein
MSIPFFGLICSGPYALPYFASHPTELLEGYSFAPGILGFPLVDVIWLDSRSNWIGALLGANFVGDSWSNTVWYTALFADPLIWGLLVAAAWHGCVSIRQRLAGVTAENAPAA